MLSHRHGRTITHRKALRHRPRFDTLEDRLAPAVFNVNSTADILNPPTGPVTLRSAIQAANGTPGGNTINLTIAGTYRITLVGTPGETDNAAGEFAILPSGGNLSIFNTSGGTVVVDGNHLNRVLDINPNPGFTPDLTVSMQGFAIQNGLAAGPDSPSSSGGAIRARANFMPTSPVGFKVVLTNMVISNNVAVGDGGGIAMENVVSRVWTLSIASSTISGNHAGGSGGAIEEDGGTGQINVSANTTITGNTAAGNGGGIWLDPIGPGTVSAVTLTNPGTGYTSAPAVLFTGGGGSGAAATAVISNGHITQIIMTNGGMGYTSPPSVMFVGGGGSGATGTAAVQTGFASGSLTLDSSIVSNNGAFGVGASGGGIGNSGGAVAITNSTVANNYSAGTGGGYGDENGAALLTVVFSVFRGNTAVGNGGGLAANGVFPSMSTTMIDNNVSGGNGGGIFDNVQPSTMSNTMFQNVTLASNTAAGDGGGIEFQSRGVLSSLEDVTVAGNRALNNTGTGHGGGLDLSANFVGEIFFAHDTIASNIAAAGGGIFWAVPNPSTIVIVVNTMIAQNRADSGPDASNPAGSSFLDDGGNLIGVSGLGSGNSGFNNSTTQTGFVANPLDPVVGVVQDNAGFRIGDPTHTVTLATVALLPGSPAIDRGISGLVPLDARGFDRVSVPDVGAYEFIPPMVAITLSLPSTGINMVGTPLTFSFHVSGPPSQGHALGTVSFFDGARLLGTTSAANSSFTTSALAVGLRHISATYSGFVVGDFNLSPATSTPVLVRVVSSLFAVAGSPGRVQIRRVADGSSVLEFQPYGPSYTGSVSVAFGDVNGDGFPDLVTGATVGNPDVRVFDGKMLAQGLVVQIAQFFAYALQFNVGANVAAGDISGNGFADIVTGASMGNPDVRVYSGKDIANGTFNPNGSSLLAQWFPYALQFNVGANVAVGDISGNGFADIVTGPTTGNPDVRVYQGQDIANGMFNPIGASLLAQFFPYALGINTGAYVAVGDTNGDGFADVITGTTIGVGQPDVRVFDGKAIAQGTFNVMTSQLDQFFAFADNRRRGVTVAAADFEGTGMFDILTGGAADTARYRVVKGNATGTEPPAVNGIDMVALDFIGGVNVGA